MEKLNKHLKIVLQKLKGIFFCYYEKYENYPNLKTFLINHEYYSKEDIENLVQDKYIIEANKNLDYETLLKEYYLNFGMDPKEFVTRIQLKYECTVIFRNGKSQSTRIIVKK